jgi:PPOX class probable F420-dependent enzyme
MSPRFFGTVARVDICMTEVDNPVITDVVRQILDGPHLSVLATTNSDGSPQTSVIFVMRQEDTILFSTIKGRRKTTNMLRHPRVNLLVHTLPVSEESTYATIAGSVELTDDPEGSFHQVMYGIHMGGATPPPEPGAERVTVRLVPLTVYTSPYGRTPAK